jgi:hypothetical protein
MVPFQLNGWVPIEKPRWGKTFSVDERFWLGMLGQDGHFVNVHRSHRAVKPKLRAGFGMQNCGGVQM